MYVYLDFDINITSMAKIISASGKYVGWILPTLQAYSERCA